MKLPKKEKLHKDKRMKNKLIKKSSFFSIFSLAVALGLSAIGFSLHDFEGFTRISTLGKIDIGLEKIRTTIDIDLKRDKVIRRMMKIIDTYNKRMPSSIKYKIACEIYKMDLKYDNINVDLICATITHESAATWDQKITSQKGALGLMQIMPKTGKYLAQLENLEWINSKTILFNPVYNIRLGSRYLSSLIEVYGLEGGLAAYNGGGKRAAMWLANNKADGILWQETQNYVPAIIRLYNKYKN